jgi:hypothetical protein
MMCWSNQRKGDSLEVGSLTTYWLNVQGESPECGS